MRSVSAATHGGAGGGGDEDGYNMATGTPTHRDVRNWSQACSPNQISDAALASLLRYVEAQERTEREAAALHEEKRYWFTAYEQHETWLKAAETERDSLRTDRDDLRAKLEAKDACWHCKDALLPTKPRCEVCPEECDDIACSEEGCREERTKADSPDGADQPANPQPPKLSDFLCCKLRPPEMKHSCKLLRGHSSAHQQEHEEGMGMGAACWDDEEPKLGGPVEAFRAELVAALRSYTGAHGEMCRHIADRLESVR